MKSSGFWIGRVVVGTRDSFSIEAKSARWSGDETRVLKALWRSWEAAGFLDGQRDFLR